MVMEVVRSDDNDTDNDENDGSDYVDVSVAWNKARGQKTKKKRPDRRCVWHGYFVLQYATGNKKMLFWLTASLLAFPPFSAETLKNNFVICEAVQIMKCLNLKLPFCKSVQCDICLLERLSRHRFYRMKPITQIHEIFTINDALQGSRSKQTHGA